MAKPMAKNVHATMIGALRRFRASAIGPATDKKQGVEALQRALGVTPAQTAVFGDYLNDLLMLEAGDWSFAMSNGPPDLRAAARYLAPSNASRGVLKVVDRLID